MMLIKGSGGEKEFEEFKESQEFKEREPGVRRIGAERLEGAALARA
jgi:hypothetical protein